MYSLYLWMSTAGHSPTHKPPVPLRPWLEAACNHHEPTTLIRSSIHLGGGPVMLSSPIRSLYLTSLKLKQPSIILESIPWSRPLLFVGDARLMAGLGQNLAVSNEYNMLAAEFLLQLSDKTDLNLLECLQLGHRHINDDWLENRTKLKLITYSDKKM